MSNAPSVLDAPPLLEVQQIGKRFAGVRALHQVNLTLAAGEVLAVVGENGAGKSTLMKVLAGVLTPDEGSIRIAGREVQIDSCRAAMRHGIVLIHQELNLADNLDVGANIFLGREPLQWGFIDRTRIDQESKRFLDLVGLDVAPSTLVRDLSIGRQQMVEIAKALSVGARVLIMDEPTSSLSTRESEQLFEVVQDLRHRGVSVIYISHRLSEVQRLANRVTVLRDGENAGELSQQEISRERIVRMMVGRDLSQFYVRQPHAPGEVVLEAKQLISPAWPAHPVDFQIRAGEVVGMAGLVGAGRSELLQVLFGIAPSVGGEMFYLGRPFRPANCADAIEAGIALVPEDRKQHGVVLEMGVRENIGLAGLKRNQLPGGFLNRQQEAKDTSSMVQKMGIKTPHVDQPVQYLSGGNQQKVVIGKWLALGPKLLLMDEPTRGIDVGAKQEIYGLMETLAASGVAVLFVSSEMDEVLGMSDRVLVMHEGKITGGLARDDFSEERIMHLATGGDLDSLPPLVPRSVASS